MKMDITTNELLEELYKELVPDIPENAVTVKMLVERGKGKINKNAAQRMLLAHYENDNWNRVRYESGYWYWPPD